MLVIFDCDGVLVDSEILAAEAMSLLLARHGLDVQTGELLQFVGMKQADILAGVAALAGRIGVAIATKQVVRHGKCPK